jgi:tetratricopeptide (TPR) repeat protein
MNPKEFYQNHQPESKSIKFVLGLFPEESATFFETEIKPLIAGKENVKFNSYLGARNRLDIIPSILNDIQNASVIITDVSGFKPNVMYELGIALLKNDNHILIANEQSKDNLPMYLANLRINYYSENGLTDFKNNISQCIDELMPELPHQCSFRPSVGDLVAEINTHVSKKAYLVASILCRELKEKDPENICVDELWAEILIKNKQLDEAREKYDLILKDNRLGRSITADIHMKKARLFISYEHKRIDDALLSCNQAESFYDRNPTLYDTWAYAHHLKRHHELACEKIEKARRLDPTNEILMHKSVFYHSWKINPYYNIGLGDYLKGRKPNTETKISPKSTYDQFKETVNLNTDINCKVISTTENGVKFETTETMYVGIPGFVHKRKISQPNYRTEYKPGDLIKVQYSGNNDKYNSIHGLNIQKIRRS